VVPQVVSGYIEKNAVEGVAPSLPGDIEKNAVEGVAPSLPGDIVKNAVEVEGVAPSLPTQDEGEQPQAAKSKGKGPGKAAKGKGGMSYKEKQEAELAAKEESLSAPEGFKGKDPLSEWELAVFAGATDIEEGPYSGRKFMPSRGYFACKRCGTAVYLAQAKFVH